MSYYEILHGATAQPQTATQAAIFDTLIGVPQSLVLMDWSMQQGNQASGAPRYTNFPVGIADAIWKRRQLYVHTWATADWVNKVSWTTADILAGRYDAYFHTNAATIKAWGHPLFVRLNHEMNGQWETHFRPGPEFQAIWHYIVSLFRADGALNITWVWCPNQLSKPGSAWTSAADRVVQWMPALDEIDWIAFDAYNWSNAKGSGIWQMPTEVFDLSYATLTALAPGKPLMIAEWNCHTTGGPTGTSADKSKWIADFLALVPTRYPAVAAVVIYPVPVSDGNWPLSTSDGTVQAYAAGVRSAGYAGAFQVMPPDMQPIAPLQSVSAWGDPLGPLTAQLGQAMAQLATTTGQLATLTADAAIMQTTLEQATEALKAADALAVTQQSALDVSNGLLGKYADNVRQVMDGVDALRALRA